MEFVQPVLNGLTIAGLLWAARALLRVSEIVAVHEWRLKTLEKDGK